MAPSATNANTNEYEPLSIETSTVDTNPDSSPSSALDSTHNGAKTAKELIGAALQKHIQAVDPHDCEAGAEDAFFVADLGDVYRQHLRWTRNLGRVTPHYAVKCNPDPQLLQLLAKLGCGFDCASKTEIEQVLSMGIDPSRVIYAQPCKTKSYLRYTTKQGIMQMTFDNADELHKIKQLCPSAELFLRIITDDSGALSRLSQKFGASMDSAYELLALAKQLELNIVGVAFHVGSGASDPNAFRLAVRDARTIFDQAASLGFKLHTLDCGGGFGSETFDEMAAVLSDALDEHFPPDIRIIAEPGRFYASTAFTLACNVIARRTVPDHSLGGAGTSYMLYLNDGVYGNLSNIIFDHQQPVPRVLRTSYKLDGYNYAAGKQSPSLTLDSGYTSAEEDGAVTVAADNSVDDAPSRICHAPPQTITYSLWGPTCDGIDCIAQQWLSADLVGVGDWMYFEDMGAYTKCSATRFNGFTDRHETIYVCSEPAAAALLES